MSGESLGGHKIFEVFMVSNDIDHMVQRLKIVPPGFEGFEYG